MKKTILIILSVILGCFLLVFFTLKTHYNKRVKDIIEYRDMTGNYEVSFTDHYDKYGEYPLTYDESIDSLLVGIEDDYLNIREYAKQYDPFSKKGSLQTMYIPLYDRESKKRESFIILSTGPDGKFDTHILPTDSVFIDSWWEKIPTYNYFESILENDYREKSRIMFDVFGDKAAVSHNVPKPKYLKFRLNYYWGDKDYIIQIGRRWRPFKE